MEQQPQEPVAPAPAGGPPVSALPAPPKPAVTFDRAVSWAVGAIVRPAATMREVSAASPVLWAIVLVAVVGLLNRLTQPSFQQLLDAFDTGAGFGGFEQQIQSARVSQLVSAPVMAVIFLLICTAIHGLTAYMFKGSASFGGLFSCFAYAYTPFLLLVPAGLSARVDGGAGGLVLYYLVAIGAFVWYLVLAVIGIREHFHFRTGRAVAVLLLPCFVLLGVFMVLIVLIIALVAALMGGFGG